MKLQVLKATRHPQRTLHSDCGGQMGLYRAVQLALVCRASPEERSCRLCARTSKMSEMMDPMLLTLAVSGHWAILLGTLQVQVAAKFGCVSFLGFR